MAKSAAHLKKFQFGKKPKKGTKGSTLVKGKKVPVPKKRGGSRRGY